MYSASAGAAELDPALARLVVAPECHAVAGSDGRFTEKFGQIVDDESTRLAIASKYVAMGLPAHDGLCLEDSVAFKRLISQWGFALAPNGTYGARSTGYGGFNVSLQASYTTIENRAEYWRLGTEGRRGTDGTAAQIGDPPALLSQYSLNVRKNFGLGIEAMANVGFVPASSLINGGLDIRVSLFEGFRSGIGAVLPDLAVGGGVRTITGTAQFQLTTVAVEGRLSKPIVIADSSILTPVIGYQYVWILGRSGSIDLTPATDALEYCGYAGAAIPRDGEVDPDADGQAICAGGTSLDYNNNVVFDEANIERQRLLVGLNYRYEYLTVGAHVLTDLLPPAEAQSSERDKLALSNCSGGKCRSIDSQWQLNFEAGFAF